MTSKRILPAIVMALALSATGCGGSDIDAGQIAADADAIAAMWDGFNRAWTGGSEPGYAWIAAHNHPEMRCTDTDYEAARSRLPGGLVWEVAVDAESIAPDPKWRLRDDAGTSFTPGGRIYEHDTVSTFSGDFPTESREWSTHSAIFDGEPVVFFPCSG